MHSRSITSVAMAAACLLGVGVKPARSEGTGKVPAHTAIERALAFLECDAVKWRKERGCATCHHGTMTIWALSEAKSQGYTVGADFLADSIQWTKERMVPRLSKPRDPREGWNLVSVPAIYLGVMSQS